jgi:hypothetical protein
MEIVPNLYVGITQHAACMLSHPPGSSPLVHAPGEGDSQNSSEPLNSVKAENKIACEI